MDTHDIGRGFRARTAKLGLCVPAVALLAGSASAQDRTARTIATAARTQNQVAERRIGKAFDLPPDLPAAFDRMALGTSARTFATFSAPSA